MIYSVINGEDNIAETVTKPSRESSTTGLLVQLNDHWFPLKVRWWNEWTDCEMLHLVSRVNSVQDEIDPTVRGAVLRSRLLLCVHPPPPTLSFLWPCCLGTYHAAPSATDINQNVHLHFRMNQQFFQGLIEFYLDFIKHLDKPIKEVAECSHQHLIHHAVMGIKSDWR